MKKAIIVFSFLLATLNLFAQNLQLFQDEKTNKYGYKEASGKIVVKAIYDEAQNFEDDPVACVNIGRNYSANKGGKWGAIDAKGKIIIPVKYDNIRYIGYNLFAVNIGEVFSNMDASWEGKFAIFHSSGKALTPFLYTGSLSGVTFESGYATLEIFDAKTKTTKYGLVDSTGKIAVPVKYDRIGVFSKEGLALLGLNGKYGFIGKTKIVLPMKYEDANGFSEELAAVKINGKWGFVDTEGQEVIAAQYEEAKYFNEGFAGVKKDGKWGVIDKANQPLLPFLYDDIIWIQREGNNIRVKLGSKYLNVDRLGHEIKQ